MAFEAELRSSIRDLQSTVTALSSEVEKSNATLRTMQGEVKGVATAHMEAAQAAGEHGRRSEELEQRVRGVGSGIKAMGGEAREAGLILRELFEFNPLALAAGAAVGFVIDRIHDLIASTKEGTSTLDEMAAAVDKINEQMSGASSRAIDTANPQAFRRRAWDAGGESDGINSLPADYQDTVKQGIDLAVQTGRVSRSEAFQRLQKIGALGPRRSGQFGDESSTAAFPRRSAAELGLAASGIEDMDAGEFERRASRVRSTSLGREASHVEAMKIVQENDEQSRLRDLLSGDSGGVHGKLVQAVEKLTKEMEKLNAQKSAIEESVEFRFMKYTGGNWAADKLSGLGFAPENSAAQLIDIETRLQQNRQQTDAALAQIAASSR